MQAVDAGRIVGPGFGNIMLEGPPEYAPPPESEPLSMPAAASSEPRPVEGGPSSPSLRPDGTVKSQEEIDLEAGRAILARLRMEKEQAEEERLKRERERPLESPSLS